MKKSAALKHFGDIRALAKAIDISTQAVGQWRGDLVPELSAWRIQDATGGKLKVNRDLYRNGRKSS